MELINRLKKIDTIPLDESLHALLEIIGDITHDTIGTVIEYIAVMKRAGEMGTEDDQWMYLMEHAPPKIKTILEQLCDKLNL